MFTGRFPFSLSVVTTEAATTVSPSTPEATTIQDDTTVNDVTTATPSTTTANAATTQPAVTTQADVTTQRDETTLADVTTPLAFGENFQKKTFCDLSSVRLSRSLSQVCNYSHPVFHRICVLTECETGFERCNAWTTDCYPLGDQCDTINDCPNGEDESVELCVAGFTQCLNNGTRVDDVINFCNCSDRYDGVLCETDLGMFRLRFVFYVNIMHEHQENTLRP